MPRAGPRESLSFQPIQCVPIGFLGKSSTARGFNMFQPSMVGENFVDTPWFHQLRGRKLPDHRSQHSVYPATVSTSVQADVPDVSCYPRSSEFQIETIPKSQNKWQYHNKSHRIQSYGIYANIGGILMVNVTIYGIHGSYGNGWSKLQKPSPDGHCLVATETLLAPSSKRGTKGVWGFPGTAATTSLLTLGNWKEERVRASRWRLVSCS